MQTKAYLRLIAVMLVIGIGLTVGCAKPPSDAQVTSDIQNKLNADSGLSGQAVGRGRSQWNGHALRRQWTTKPSAMPLRNMRLRFPE